MRTKVIAMNDSIFIPCDRKVLKNIKKTVEQYNLCECYTGIKGEKIFKNKDFLLLKKKKYIFIKAFCQEDTKTIQQVRSCLQK